MKKAAWFLALLMAGCVSQPGLREEAKPGQKSARVAERLDRGLVAMPVEKGKVYLSWRSLREDGKDRPFDVFRRTSGGKAEKLTTAPVTMTSDFTDLQAPQSGVAVYWVESRGEKSKPANVDFSKPATPYLSIPLEPNETFQKVGIADLNSDGRYDFVLKSPNTNIDPYKVYWKRSPGTYTIEARLDDGTLLWQNDLGWPIEQGIWYSPYLVYDFDGDGRAEVAVKTGEGDPRDADGRVQTGSEYLSIWDGMIGKEITRVPWLPRIEDYNFSSRNQLGVAYLDGKTPSLLMARGTYSDMYLSAFAYRGRRLVPLWSWSSSQEAGKYRGQGAHFMHCADVDGDGCDEVILGSSVIDHTGHGLWTTGLGHPDHCYVGDIDPAHPGLEIYYGIERPHERNGIYMADAKTGAILWGVQERTFHIHSQGLVSDFDARHPGMECYSAEKDVPKDKPRRWLHTANGTLLAREDTCDMGLIPRAAFWDADPQRELINGGRIFKFETGAALLQGIQGSEIAWADILGDWREEIVASVPGELRIYTTAIPATTRRPCLMYDPIYRTDVAHLSMGYAQPPMVSACLP